jgi:hypothetical protein
MKKNVEINGLGEQQDALSDPANPKKIIKWAKIQVNEGDAW